MGLYFPQPIKIKIMDTLEFVSRVFTVLGQNIVKQHTADLIIDLPKAVKTLESGGNRTYARKGLRSG